MTKIVRKLPNEAINQVSFRLNGEKVEWCVEAARDGFWYPTTEHIAWVCGTTLAALRAELTEEGEG